MKKLLSLILLLLSFYEGHSQLKRLIDSLHQIKNRLEEQKQKSSGGNTYSIDTSTVGIYQQFITAYWNMIDDSVRYYGQKSLDISQPLAYQKGIANGYCAIGFYYLKADSMSIGIRYMNQALSIRRSIRDYYGICRTLTSIGVYESNNEKALRLHLEALKIARDHGIREMEAAILHNIGRCYGTENNPALALEYYFKAKTINEQAGGNKKFLAANLVEIGLCYLAVSKYEQARTYFNAAIVVASASGNFKKELEAMNNLAATYDYSESEKSIAILLQLIQLANQHNAVPEISRAYMNLGDIYYFNKNYSKALYYDTMALRMLVEQGDSVNIANAAVNTGMVYMGYKQYQKALDLELQALKYNERPDNLDFHKWIYKNLSEIYQHLGDYKKSLENYKLFKVYDDSMNNNENKEKVLKVTMQADFTKKEDAIKAAQEKKDFAQRNIRNAILAGLLILSFFLLVVYRQRNRVKREKERSEELLLNILPVEVADELKDRGESTARSFDNVTVLFTDFVEFTKIGETLSPQVLVQELHECFSAFDTIIERNGLEKIKTIGDAYMAVCGLPHETKDHAQRVVKAALEIREYVANSQGKFQIRIGIHSGAVVAGIVGVKKFAYDIWGDTVNTANRMEANSEPGKINISGSTYDLVKEDFNCKPRGKISVKGKGEVDMYFLES